MLPCAEAEKTHVMVEVIVTKPGSKPVFHVLGESLCINYSVPPRTGPWSKKMSCCRGLEKVNAVG